MAPQVKLIYFDLFGRAEAIRMLLAAGKVEYEDCRLTSEEWKTIKPTTPFGGVPVLHWDGEEIPQANTILRFVAKNCGLDGKDDIECARADSILEHCNELFIALGQLRSTKSQDLRVKQAFTFLGETLPAWLGLSSSHVSLTTNTIN